MKKLLVVLLAGLSLVACSHEAGSSADASAPAASATEASAPAQEASAPAPAAQAAQ